MKKSAAFFLFVWFLFAGFFPAHSALKDFKKGVEKEERKEKRERRRSSGSGGGACIGSALSGIFESSPSAGETKESLSDDGYTPSREPRYYEYFDNYDDRDIAAREKSWKEKKDSEELEWKNRKEKEMADWKGRKEREEASLKNRHTSEENSFKLKFEKEKKKFDDKYNRGLGKGHEEKKGKAWGLDKDREWKELKDRENIEWKALKERQNKEWQDFKKREDIEWKAMKEKEEREWQQIKLKKDREWKELKDWEKQEREKRKGELAKQKEIDREQELEWERQGEIERQRREKEYREKQGRPGAVVVKSEPQKPAPKKYDNRIFFSLEAGGKYAWDDGWGFFGATRLLFFNFIGPDFEARSYWDGEDTLQYYGAGLCIGYTVNRAFVPALYVHAALMRGVVERNGASLGIDFHAYPVKPLAVTLRIGGQFYEYIEYIDVEGRLGLFFKFFEVFAGYRYMGAKYSDLHGPVFGIRIVI